MIEARRLAEGGHQVEILGDASREADALLQPRLAQLRGRDLEHRCCGIEPEEAGARPSVAPASARLRPVPQPISTIVSPGRAPTPRRQPVAADQVGLSGQIVDPALRPIDPVHARPDVDRRAVGHQPTRRYR